MSDIKTHFANTGDRIFIVRFCNNLRWMGSQAVQSITGFIDRTGEHFVTRRSVKIFQRSQPVGVGVCHRSLPPSLDFQS